ncbi:MAG: hypothetical protein AAF849_19215, partial [Bacteroidota bacterium]
MTTKNATFAILFLSASLCLREKLAARYLKDILLLQRTIKMDMDYQIQEEGKFKYIESKGGEQNLLLLHGLFGALSNFSGIVNHFKGTHNVIIPILPIFDLPPKEVSLENLVEHINDF